VAELSSQLLRQVTISVRHSQSSTGIIWALVFLALKIKIGSFLKDFEEVCYLHSFIVNQTGPGK